MKHLIEGLNYDTEQDLRAALGWVLPPDDKNNRANTVKFWIKNIKHIGDGKYGFPTYEVTLKNGKKVEAQKPGVMRGHWDFKYNNKIAKTYSMPGKKGLKNYDKVTNLFKDALNINEAKIAGGIPKVVTDLYQPSTKSWRLVPKLPKGAYEWENVLDGKYKTKKEAEAAKKERNIKNKNK